MSEKPKFKVGDKVIAICPSGHFEAFFCTIEDWNDELEYCIIDKIPGLSQKKIAKNLLYSEFEALEKFKEFLEGYDQN